MGLNEATKHLLIVLDYIFHVHFSLFIFHILALVIRRSICPHNVTDHYKYNWAHQTIKIIKYSLNMRRKPWCEHPKLWEIGLGNCLIITAEISPSNIVLCSKIMSSNWSPATIGVELRDNLLDFKFLQQWCE